MKLLYISDLHGIQWKYEVIFELSKSLKVNAVVNGGDMLPLENFLNQDVFITEFLDSYFKKFENQGIYYIGLLGNDDLIIFDDLFDRICNKYDFIINIAQKKANIQGFEFIGMNWVTDVPFALKDRARKDTKNFILPNHKGEAVISTNSGWKKIKNWPQYIDGLPTIEEELNNLVKPFDMNKSIYVIHMPPANSELDVIFSGQKVGSIALYNFIKKNQPLMSFHGHIHESPDVSGVWYSQIGKTFSIQPGQSNHSQDFLVYSLIDLKKLMFDRYIVKKDESSFI